MSTFPLSITLITPNKQPVVGATCIITPQTVVPSDTGTVLTTAAATTDANGHAELQLIPSVAGTWYILRINSNVTINVINPFRFQMPPQATSLTELLQGAISRNEPIPEGVHVNFDSMPFADITHPAITDVDLNTVTTGDGWGDWTEIHRATNTSDSNEVTQVLADVVFEPQWPRGANARAEVDVRMHHDTTDGTLVHDLVTNEYIYIRNSDNFVDKGSAEIVGIAELKPTDYIIVEARARRQSNAAGMVRMLAAESGVTVARFAAITSSTVRINTDNTLKRTGNEYGVTNPFTAGDENKLDAIEPNATADQTPEEISAGLNAITTEADKVDYDNLQNKPTIPRSSTPAVDDLTDVTITNPQAGDLITRNSANTGYVNQQPHATLDGDDIVNILENRQPTGRLDRKYLQGQTTVTGGTVLPAPADVSNWTLFVRQSTSADNPGLYLSGATYDVPIANRNRITVTPDSTGEYFIGQRGSADDNYNNVLGQFIGRAIGGGQALLGFAIHFGSDTPVTTPPATLYVRGINGSNAVRAIQRSTSSQHPTGTSTTINGKQYAEYVDTVASSVVDNVDGNSQELTFFTNAAGSLPMNIKPATEHRTRNWHLQSPVTPDWSITDQLSPAFIRNKPTIPTLPTPSSIGRVVATTTNLPTSATTLSRRGTTQVSIYLPQLSAGVVTTGYTVSANTVESIQPHPVSQIGWWARAVTGTTEVCRVFIPLTATITYATLGSIVDTQRVVSHALFGTHNGFNLYLAYQASMGGQTRLGQSGSTAHDIELFIASPQQPVTVNFPANTKIELVEAVVG